MYPFIYFLHAHIIHTHIHIRIYAWSHTYMYVYTYTYIGFFVILCSTKMVCYKYFFAFFSFLSHWYSWKTFLVNGHTTSWCGYTIIYSTLSLFIVIHIVSTLIFGPINNVIKTSLYICCYMLVLLFLQNTFPKVILPDWSSI